MTKPGFSPNASDSIVVRLKLLNPVEALALATEKIAEENGSIGAMDIVNPLQGRQLAKSG